MPYYDNEVPLGTSIRLINDDPFTTFDQLTIVDPDVVTIYYAQANGPTVSFTYTNGATPPDPTYNVKRQAPGVYYMDVDDDTLGAGVLMYWIEGAPGTSGLDTTRTKVRSKKKSILLTE